MLHERPGVQTSRQADENQGIGDYQCTLTSWTIRVELPQPLFMYSVQHMIFNIDIVISDLNSDIGISSGNISWIDS